MESDPKIEFNRQHLKISVACIIITSTLQCDDIKNEVRLEKNETINNSMQDAAE